MLILILSISILVIIASCFGIYFSPSFRNGEAVFSICMVCIVVFCIVGIISLIELMFNISDIIDGKVIDQKIVLYEEENQKIENSLQELIDSYMAYESETLKSLKVEDVSVAVLKIPELKADTLIQEKITVLNENRRKIVSLKEAKIDLKVKEYWVSFKKVEE